MTNRFLWAVGYVLRHEGGYVNNPADPGGETNYGISHRSHPDVDIKNLTREEAKQIYWKEYWKPWMDLLDDAVLSLMIFDFGVNAGLDRAIKRLQSEFGVKVDGVVGPVTLNAINGRETKSARRRFFVRVLMYYIALVLRNPSMTQFLKSWLKRATDNVLSEGDHEFDLPTP